MRTRNAPRGKSSPATPANQRARRTGSVIADQRSSMSVSYRSSIRTTPAPSADRMLPRMRVPGLALLVMSRSFVRVFLAPPRYAGRPIADPTETDSGQATDRLLRAGRGGDCRPVAAPPGGPRPALLPSTLAGGGRRRDERWAVTQPAHPRLPGRGQAYPTASCGPRRRPLAEQLPWLKRTKTVT